MKILNDVILVETSKQQEGILLDGVRSEKYSNSGKVIGVSGNISSVQEGDVVHFSDTAGIYVDKKTNPNLIALNIQEIAFISDDPNICVYEDLSFEMTFEVDPRDKVCII